ncbi:MAG: hypothetical protein PHI98_09750 [Eubacteriales bacterium]|nr:hypothetical protein [Eubacteriales bacterium]
MNNEMIPSACVERFAHLAVTRVLAEGPECRTLLLEGQGGEKFVLKSAWGRRKNMLLSEWSALQKLDRDAPGCAPIPILHGEDGDEAWLLRAHVSGQTLSEWVEAHGQIPVRQSIAVANRLIALVGQIHRANMICRDIKPENLVQTATGDWMFIDAGTVRTPDHEKTRDTALYITSGFSAPEQFGFSQTDRRADVYALGVTLCWLFTGGLDAAALRRPGIPFRVRHTITRCMAFSPKGRFESMEAVARSFNARGVRIAVAAAASALVLAAIGFAAVRLWAGDTMMASDQGDLLAAADACAKGKQVSVNVSGDIVLDTVLHVRDGTLVLSGDGVISTLQKDWPLIRVHAGGRLILEDHVTLLGTQNGNCAVVDGGEMILKGGVVKRLPESREQEVSPPLLINEGGVLRIEGGQIYIRRGTGVAIGVTAQQDTSVFMTSGRVDAMANSCIGVLMQGDSKFTITGGTVSVVARLGTGYAVQDMDLATISDQGGEMLVNGAVSVPLEISYTAVSTYDELVRAISANITGGRLAIDGEIHVMDSLYINDGRQISLVGKDQNAKLIGDGNSMFWVDESASLELRNLTLEEHCGIDNRGLLTYQNLNVRMKGNQTFIINRGECQALYVNDADLESGYLLENMEGAQATVTSNVTTGSGMAAYKNNGDLRLINGSVNFKFPQALLIENSANATSEVDGTTVYRNGVLEE